MDTMRAKRERDEERQMENQQRHGDTQEPLRHITTMVVYLGVGKLVDDRETAAEDPTSGGQGTRCI